MNKGYIIERGLFLEEGFIHVFNWPKMNKYAEYMLSQRKRQDDYDIGIWKLKVLKP